MSETRLGKARSSRILQGSAWILIGLGIQSALGFTFWFLGSRVATPGQLGRASALFTAIQFVNYASGLGLTIALARHATSTDDEADSLFTWGIGATVLSSVVAGTIFLAAVHEDYTRVITGSPWGWIVFCLYTAGTSVGLLVDVRLMAARRWDWLVGRITITCLLRLPLVLLDVGRSDAWLYHLMLAPLAIGGVVSVPLLSRIGAGGVRLARPRTLGSVARYSAVNWLATLASQAPQFVLPLLVAITVRDAVYANFFIAWTVTGLVFLVPGAIAQVLLVEGSKEAVAAETIGPAASDASLPVDALQPLDDVAHPDASGAPGGHHAAGAPEPVVSGAREALTFSLGLAGIAWVGALVGRQLVQVVFGDAYERTAKYLPALMLAGIPWAITSVRLSEARIRRDQLATVAITLTLGLGILVPAKLWIPSSGTTGAIRAWLLGNTAACVVAVFVHQRRRWMSKVLG